MDETSSAAKGSHIFHILVVDDDPSEARLLREMMKILQRPHELHFVLDGSEALDFLRGKAPYAGAPRPHLVLLDLHMPRVGGLETLSAIKGDPELCVIPVIMLSSSDSPSDVRKSYQAHANGYVRKPTDLSRMLQLVQAFESFWMDFVLFTSRHPQRSPEIHTGRPIASKQVEASSGAIRNDGSLEAVRSRQSGCPEHNHLLDEFGGAVRELIDLHEQQFRATVEGDSDCHRFDLLIHMANEKKQLAKYSYLRHLEEHGCLNFDALDNVRT